MRKNHNVTYKKLNGRKDYYRVQVQIKRKELMAVIYNAIADRDKSAAGKIRDEWADDIEQNIIRHAETLFGTVGFARHMTYWIENNVDADARTQVKLFIKKVFGVTLPPPDETLL